MTKKIERRAFPFKQKIIDYLIMAAIVAAVGYVPIFFGKVFNVGNDLNAVKTELKSDIKDLSNTVNNFISISKDEFQDNKEKHESYEKEMQKLNDSIIRLNILMGNKIKVNTSENLKLNNENN